MKAMKTLSRPLAAPWVRLGLVAAAAVAALPAAAVGFHGHGSHGGGHGAGAHAGHTGHTVHTVHTVHASPAPSSHGTGSHVHTAAHPPAPPPPPPPPAPPPMTAARVHAAGEHVRHSPTPEVRPAYYAMPRATSALRVQSLPVRPNLAKVELKTPERPDHVTEVGGNGSPRVAFNRRSIGGASGADSVRRDAAYRQADNRPAPNATPEQLAAVKTWRRARPFMNDGTSVKLPTDFARKPAEYVSYKPKKEPVNELLTSRYVVAKHPQDLLPGVPGKQATGAGYMSRHYGDRAPGGPQTGPMEPVIRIQ